MRQRLEHRQRLVLVVGLGFAGYVLGTWLTNLDNGFTGWTAYAPLSNNTFTLVHGGLRPWVRVVIWLCIIALWVLTSLWLLRPERGDDTHTHGDRA
jgi:heme/copper-type cytochrome/quinol oxidase subunit 1